ncbi:MAG TPA: hypothetical protein VFT29_15955 [Gemmatimonadaceae bacterium]|nr:hypothetical protein [Gemmatimonadaceae bacterium]
MEYSIRRYVPILIAGALLLAAACSDSVAPTPNASRSANPTLTAFGGTALARVNGEPRTVKLVLRAKGGRVRVGGFVLDYPAGAVCDPATSSYGPDFWTQPCETLRSDITVSATVWSDEGRTQIDISPDIRFDPGKVVTLSAHLKELKGERVTTELEERFAIWYSTRVGDDYVLIDETAQFPELATAFETKKGVATGWVTRRIYHFSGYYVRSGRACDDSSCDDNLLQ